MAYRWLLKFIFKMLDLPNPNYVESARMNKWMGDIYPLKEFHDYIASRNKLILQSLGNGISREQEYWIQVGQRMELGLLLTNAKNNFEKNEKARKAKQK